VWPLIVLKEIGTNMLLNRPINDDAQQGLVRLWQDFQSWDAHVLGALSSFGATESQLSHFRTLGTFPARSLSAYNGAHAQLLNTIAEKLERLENITQQLEH